MADSLMSLVALWARNLPTLVKPPGSSLLLALLITVAGLEIGLNMPYTVSDILAVRTMGMVAMGVANGDTSWQQAFSAIYTTLKAMPSPSAPAVGSAIALATAVLVGAGGWINTSLALIQGKAPSESTWKQGVRRSWVSTLWFLILFGFAFSVVGASAAAGAAVLRGALMGALAPGQPTMLAAAGALTMFFVSMAVAFYGLAVTSLTGIVAIAEPETSFFRVPIRAYQVFKTAKGWRFLRQLGLVLGLWFAAKTAAYQLVIPFAPIASWYSLVVSAAGAIFYTMLTIGDGLVFLLAILMASRTYLQGLKSRA